MRKSICTLLFLVVVVFACSAQIVVANPAPAPSAFMYVPTTGVSLVPTQFSSGTLAYTLMLGSDAALTWGGNDYPIVSVWGFYAVNMTDSGASDFTATGSDIGEWKWDQKPNSGTALSVGGWLDSPKNEALLTPLTGTASKVFTYSQFVIPGATPLLGLHVSVSIPAGLPSPFPGGVTGAIIPQVPEPAAILALLTGVAGLGGLMRRRTR